VPSSAADSTLPKVIYPGSRSAPASPRAERAPAASAASAQDTAAQDPTSWRADVVSAPGLAQGTITSALPADDAARYNLVRDIQRELKRVGCYWGEIDGSWGGSSKWALGEFMDRVNASLPVEQPDYILLSLIKAQGASVCGTACPKGQSRTGEGRCLPSAIVAQTTRKALAGEAPQATPPAGPRYQPTWTAEVRPMPGGTTTPPPAPLPGRMTVGGPVQSSTMPESAAERSAAFGGGAGVSVDISDSDGIVAEAGGADGTLEGAPPAVEPPALRPLGGREQSERWRHYGGSASVQRLFMHPLGM
jgi:hypothetical protein